MAFPITAVVDPGLAPTHGFRHRAEPDLVDAIDPDDEPMTGLMREVTRELAADAALVAWHADGCPPVSLIASDTCAPPAAARMLEAARLALIDERGDVVRWAGRDGGVEALLTLRTPTVGGSVTVTLSFRRIAAASMARTRAAASAMLPMIGSFFRLWSSQARALSANRGLTAALNSSDVATLLVDAAGGLVFANAAAERMLGKRDGLRRTGGMLGGSRLADTMRLQASIEHVARGVDAVGDGGREAAAPSPVVALACRSGRPLLAAIVPADRSTGAPGHVAAIVHVFDPGHDLEPLLAPVCRLYALSPVEGRLASLLARGMPLIDAAKVMCVQEQTARSYLKQVFLKTDTNRQAELVWLMLKSAVRTAPECPTRLV